MRRRYPHIRCLVARALRIVKGVGLGLCVLIILAWAVSIGRDEGYIARGYRVSSGQIRRLTGRDEPTPLV